MSLHYPQRGIDSVAMFPWTNRGRFIHGEELAGDGVGPLKAVTTH